MEKRRAALDESLKFHKFNFEIDTELQWINERLPAANSDTVGQNLYQAQGMDKKHKKLQAEIEGHQPMITKTLHAGQFLIEQKHPEAEKAKESCNQLEGAGKISKRKLMNVPRNWSCLSKRNNIFLTQVKLRLG